MIFILQAVREVYEIVPTRKWKNEETRVNKIVFIGNTLSQIVSFYILLHILGCICNLRKKNGFLIYFFSGRSLNEEILVNTMGGCTV